MMIALFVILMLVFLTAGYKLLEQVDFFLAHHLVTDNREALETDVMWFIDTPLSRRLNPQLLSIGVTVSTLGGNESVYFKGVHCIIMCAQSEDDQQNAMVCAAWKLYGNCDDVLALCNQEQNRSLFESMGIACLSPEEMTADRLYLELHG